jgi:putative ABC transport system permease protein
MMEGLDRWREILEVLWRRKLRTALTALSVAWGIFMLVVLLAAGRGLSNGAEAEFGRDAANVLWLAGGQLSKAHQGNPIGKRVRLFNDDYLTSQATVPIIEHARVRARLPATTITRRGQRRDVFPVIGCLPGNELIEKSELVRGRFINVEDQREARKVAVIGVKVEAALFPGHEPSLGGSIVIGQTVFTVVGVFEEEAEEDEQQIIYIPLATAQGLLKNAGRIDDMTFMVGEASADESARALETLTGMLAARHGFAPDDKQALRAWNNQAVNERFQTLFAGIRAFVWIIGLGTILAGVVGVSNIMLISVQERTREIGVRKAVGARPSSIIAMILQEALAITVVSGYLGLVAAVAVVAAAQSLLPNAPYFRHPDVDLTVGLGATAVLVLSGVLAGLFPALRAARINPIAALRVE